MVFEGRIGELLQNQASRFLRGFSSEQLRIGLLSGRLELVGLALNAEPLDSLLLESEVPLVMKAGVLMSAVTQISILQGELELVIDGLILVLGPACRWLTRTEVHSHRQNEIQRLEFVHMRSQCQRRTLEREMFRQLFSDYLSRLKISVKNVHIRIEVEGEVDSAPSGRNRHACFGICLGSCDISAVKGVVSPPDKDKDPSQSELLLAESVQVKNLSLYHESSEQAKLHVTWNTYYNTRNRPLAVFDELKQEKFVQLMADSWRQHAMVPAGNQLMPAANFDVAIDLRSQPIRDGFHTDSCLTMEITVKLDAASRLQFSTTVIEHLQWFVRRTLDFQLWQFLHPVRDTPERARDRWAIIREFVALKRRIHSNSYALSEAITMRINCKEYVRLYKKKFNGQGSPVQWRKSLPSLTHSDTLKLNDIELVYPADKLVNFRLMAHAELKTELALNSFLNSDESGAPGPYRRAARELTPLEQLHLHGQHGYGVNIYRGLPPPPSSLKIRIDLQAPLGLWWICRLSGISAQPGGRVDNENCWTVAVDCAKQPLRLLLVDSIVDASVFATIEVPKAPPGQRPFCVLLGKTAAAFVGGSPGRNSQQRQPDVGSGGKGNTEWCSVFELDGPIYCCSQLKTVLTSAPNSPWDIFVHFSCGDVVELERGGQHPLDGFSSMPPPQRAHTAIAGTGGLPDSCIRIRVPLALASGQAGPLVALLKQCLSTSRSPNGKSEVGVGPSHSAIAWLIRRIGSTRDVAIFRLHLRVPPVHVEAAVAGGPSVWLPRFDAACHLEHGGLIDGFVVGLHHLRHFAASLASAAAEPAAPSPQSNSRGGSHRNSGATPWSLLPLEQSPSCTLMIAAFAAAFAVTMGSRPQGRGGPPDLRGIDAALLALVKTHQLAGVFAKSADPDSPMASVTLLLVLLTIMIGRRVLWNERDSRPAPGGSEASGPSAEVSSNAVAAVGEIHRLAGGMMRALLVMGFPLHPRCLPLASWCGALEILEAVSQSPPPGTLWPPSGLAIWAARGAYANLQARQDEVVRWLLRQQAKIEEVDQSGRSLLDWACWGGSESLASMALRAGILSPPPRALGDTPSPTIVLGAKPNPSSQAPPPTLALLPPSPLTLAVAGRSQKIVSMLLRAAGDPHAPPRGGSCGPLLLAVRTCEYDLGCQVLRDAAYVSVDAALGPTLSSSTQGTQNGAVSMKSMENSSDAASLVGCTVRATVALVDSLRRFAGSLSRRTAEDYGTSMSHASLRSHLPGPHLDEGLYATGQMPFSDILHPLAVQLPLPLHKVGHEFRPHPPPHRWLRRGTVNPWSRAQRFIECCIKRDFRPDIAVVSRALPALPPEARAIVQQLLLGASPHDGAMTNGDMGGDGGNNPLWIGAVLGNDIEERRRNGGEPYGSPQTQSYNFGGQSPVRSEYERTPERNELSAAISFAKEIRELRTGSGSQGMPPLDIAAALGVDGQGNNDYRANGAGGPKQQKPGPSHRLQASPGPPTVWANVSLGGPSPAAGPVSLDALRIHNNALSLKLRDAAGRTIHAFNLQDIAAIRQYELSGFEGPEMKSFVEIRLQPHADAVPLVEGLLLANEGPQRNNGWGLNGNSGTAHIVGIVFLRAEDAEQFAGTLQSSWQSAQTPEDGTQELGRGDDVQGFLAGGPWDPAQLYPCIVQNSKASSSSSLPKVRAAVIGAPRVGKTRVAACILNELGVLDPSGIPREGESGPGFMRVAAGTWPATGAARAEVHVWDGSSSPLPGILSRMVTEPSVSLFLVVVVDAAFAGLNGPSEALAAACAAEVAAAPSAGQRRVLFVENTFTGTGPSVSRTGKTIRCNLRDAQGLADLRKTVAALLGELVVDVEAKRKISSEVSVPPVMNARDDWGAVCATRPQLPPVASGAAVVDPFLASRLRGDTALLDPAAVAWAWTVIRGAHGCLAEGYGSSSAGGAVVPWERLERVLGIANAGHRGGSDAAFVLLRALADVGLVCPIPSLGVGLGDEACLTCSPSTWVLVPDFARRIRLLSAAALRQACGETVALGESLESASGDKGALSARVMLDATNGAGMPSLRSALRDFLARASVGILAGASSTTARQFELRRFVLLEAGPGGSPSITASDGLAPGFLLVFDLVPRNGTEDGLQTGGPGSPVAKPPASVREATPSGQRNSDGTPRHGLAAGLQSDDDIFTAATSRSGGKLTVLTVGVSGDAKKGEKPFWDLHCLGPHAQWACRIFFGPGASGPNFAKFSKMAANNKGRSSSSSSVPGAWPLPTPACVLSQQGEGGGLFGGGVPPASAELGGWSWLFSGPQGNGPTRAIVPVATAGGESTENSPCCCNCIKRPEPPARRIEEPAPLVPSQGPTRNCSDFEAAILARSWFDVSRHLDEALSAGPEAWSLCAAVLCRLAHDYAAAAAGSDARALPMLTETGGGGMGGSSKVVALVPEGPLPLAVGMTLRPPGAALGQLSSGPGVEGWLRLCRPAALWSAAGASKGYTAAANELLTAAGSGSGRVGEQVGQALQQAVSVQLTTNMVDEVWKALAKLPESKSLFRRAGGTWVQTVGAGSESSGFLL